MTETTQPDPQVVADVMPWMRRYVQRAREVDPARAVRAFQQACPEQTRGTGLAWIVSAYYQALNTPLTVADIPAGQGPASLYLHDGHLYHRGADGRSRPVEYGGWHEAVDAMDALLAAHLPTIDTEDVDLTPLFDTPQIHTDSDSRHWDDTGREHRAVDVDGELTYQPAADATEESK